MERTITWAGILLLVSLAGSGCSKHECSFDSDAEKEAFGELADMTEGASRCDVTGTRVIEGVVIDDIDCDVGSDNCVATMETFHGDGAQHAKVASDYKSYLDKQGWDVDKSEYESERANGKPLTGTKLRAQKGDVVALVSLYNLADGLVEGSTALIDKSKAKPKE